MLREFKEFAIRGNVVDLAVGIIVGGAFGNITTSLVNDIVMPPIGLLLGRVDFTDLFVNLSSREFASLAAAQAAGAPTVNYGLFITTVINFLVVAFAVFLLVRAVNRLRRRQDTPAAPPPAPTRKDCPYCLSDIPVKAIRCPHCTSALDDLAAAR